MNVAEIKEIDRAFSKMLKVEKNRPGLFAGWIDEKFRVAWVVSPHRIDRRTGAVDRFPEGDYVKELHRTVSLGIPLSAMQHVELVEAPEETKPVQLVYTLHYVEQVGKLRLGKFYTLESSDIEAAWEKAYKLLELRKVSEKSRLAAVLYDGELKIPNPEKLEKS